ncbi:hypothetical protein ANTQUA_LOCUS7990 [Anthophora quadrimaculata]
MNEAGRPSKQASNLAGRLACKQVNEQGRQAVRQARQADRQVGCHCGTITTMGYRTAAIAGEMPNGLQDCAGLAVRSLARSGMADGR